jgi:hypothetical protein
MSYATAWNLKLSMMIVMTMFRHSHTNVQRRKQSENVCLYTRYQQFNQTNQCNKNSRAKANNPALENKG